MIKIMKPGKVLILSLLSCTLVPVLPCQGRQNSVTGSINLNENFDSNIYQDDRRIQGEWVGILTPGVTLTSSDSTNSLLLNYAPGLAFYHRTDEHKIDQRLTAQGLFKLASHLQMNISDNYVEATQTTERDGTVFSPESGIILSDNKPRGRYRTNAFTWGGVYDYAQESSIRVGYSHNTYKNDSQSDTGTSSDYTRHMPSLSLAHMFNRNWSSQFDLSYTKADFDRSDDLETIGPRCNLAYRVSPMTKILAGYAFTSNHYLGITPDSTIHSPFTGLQYQYSQYTNLAAEVGISLLERADSNNQAFYFSANASHRIQRGSLSLSGKSGYDIDSFGGKDNGLTRYWLLSSQFNYEVLEKLIATANLSYQEQEPLEQITQNKNNTFTSGVGLRYPFLRWYSMSLNYLYRNVDTNGQGNNYNDHQIFLAVSASKELWRW